VHRDELEGHRCDEEPQADVVVRRELTAFDGELGAWLDTPQGRFAAWLAEHERP
jgi:hypothetical protein